MFTRFSEILLFETLLRNKVSANLDFEHFAVGGSEVAPGNSMESWSRMVGLCVGVILGVARIIFSRIFRFSRNLAAARFQKSTRFQLFFRKTRFKKNPPGEFFLNHDFFRLWMTTDDFYFVVGAGRFFSRTQNGPKTHTWEPGFGLKPCCATRFRLWIKISRL